MLLLTRDEFRRAVFERDEDSCVTCWMPAVDAHHIIERRLFPDGGYYLDNGASLCGTCHYRAESTELTCEEIREGAGITNVVLPPHLYPDQRYDKWGNPYLPNGMRVRGELFWDESVQRALTYQMASFTHYVKYPRTYHLPWSPGVTKDDRVMEDLGCFEGAEVVVTVKMDGENTTLYKDYIHARSVDYNPHPSRNRAKAIWARIAHDIPEGWRVCAENLYARHSIPYHRLEGYLQVFSVWNQANICLDWDSTFEWAALLGLPLVPVHYRGLWDEDLIRAMGQDLVRQGQEGLVVRTTSPFPYHQFRYQVAKYVRADHVQTHGHWMRQHVVPNTLAQP